MSAGHVDAMFEKRLQWLGVGVLVVAAAALRFRIGYHWQYAGSDSYGYLKLADQLWQHGRYALSPTDPPHYGRMPLYPLFVALAKRNHVAQMSGGDGWIYITYAQICIELLTLPLVYLMARRLAGVAGGLLALALAALTPFTAIYTSAVLSESLATSLTTMTAALLVLGCRSRPRLRFFFAGALVALSTLTRPDGIFLATALIPAAWMATRSARGCTRLLLWGAVGFALLFAPWVGRNLYVFGQPHAFGARVDRDARPLPYYHGWWRWTASWGSDETPQAYLLTCFYDPSCDLSIDSFPPQAFGSVSERQRAMLLLSRRAHGAPASEVGRGFELLAAERERNHPVRVFVELPLSRAMHMWASRFDELHNSTLWRGVPRGSVCLPLTIVLSLALLGASVLLLVQSDSRAQAAVLALPILTRTLVLSFNNYSMPRYLVEVWPLVFILISWGLVESARTWRDRRRARAYPQRGSSLGRAPAEDPSAPAKSYESGSE